MSAGALTAALQQLAAADSSGDEGDDGDADGRYSDTDSQWGAPGGGGGDDADERISPEEEAALARFMPGPEGLGPGAAGAQRSLAETILERIRENQRQQGLEALPE